MRKTARLKLEYISLLEENKSIHEMLGWCDSVRVTHMDVIVQLDDLLGIKEEKILNLHIQYRLSDEKYQLANSQIKIERKKKYLFMGVAVTAVTTAAIVIIKTSIKKK